MTPYRQAVDDDAFGPLLATFRAPRATVTGAGCMAALLGVVGVLFLVSPIFDGPTTLLFVGVALVAFAVLLGRASMREGKERVELREGGVVQRGVGPHPLRVEWSQIDNVVTHMGITSSRGRAPSTTAVWLRIATRDGHLLETNATMQDSERLAQEIQRRHASLALPPLLASLREGKSARFGDITLTEHAVEDAPTIIPLASVRAATLGLSPNAIASVVVQGATPDAWIERDAPSVPNAHLLVAAIDALRAPEA